jgi:hypothetical protein
MLDFKKKILMEMENSLCIAPSMKTMNLLLGKRIFLLGPINYYDIKGV